jgi:aspartyl-tRNA(Asn)/glutamyl-tRNA(Gln) amidotransferase subunit A
MKLTRVPAPVNVAGLAALSVPCGITGAGLPVGLQLIAREEAILLAAGRAIEIATGWTPMVAG